MHDDQGGFFIFHFFDINNWAKLSIKLVKFKLRKPIFFQNIPKTIAKKMAYFSKKIINEDTTKMD